MPLPPPQLDRAIDDLRAGRRSEGSFEQIFRAYHGLVAGYFERHGATAEEAADLAQEVFLVVHDSIGALKDSTSFRSWLFGIARNKLLRHYERTYKDRQYTISEAAGEEKSLIEHVPDQTRGALENVLDLERRTKLREALEELPQQMRACVRLSVVDGHEYGEIASRLGVSVSTVKVQIHRAKHNLAAKMSVFFGKPAK